MASSPISRTLASEAHAAVKQHGSVKAAAMALGVGVNKLTGRYKAALERYGLPDVRGAASRASAGPRGQAGAPLAPPPAPTGFVVAQHSAQTDAAGNVEREWTKSKPAPGDVFEAPEGHEIKGVSALVDGDGRVLAQWIKTREGSSAVLVDALREAFAEFDGLVPPSDAPAVSDDDLLTLYPVPDLHLGMYAWAPEVGQDYDISIASRRAMEAIDGLIVQSRPSAEAVILVLGDYFHADNQKNTTPASGHQLDVDGRRPKVYRAGVDLLMRIVERAKARHARVRVVVIPGNHDPDSAVTLTVAMSVAYARDARVIVEDGPNDIWYLRFGRVLLGATHGHTMSPDAMGMAMAADRPEDWGATWHKHFFFGHIHHRRARDVGPVEVESFATPAVRDSYAHQRGYRSGQRMAAVTFHRELGEVGRHRVNITPRKARVRVKAA
jgi:predicted phosphodiesterase